MTIDAEGPNAAPLKALAELIERAHSVAPARLLQVVREAGAVFGATSVDVLLIDFAQEHLTVLEAEKPTGTPRRVPVEGSTAGLAFIKSSPVATPLPHGRLLISVPLLDGIERLGVLQLMVASDREDILASCRRFTELVTQFLTSKGRVTDEFHRLRSVEPMSLAAQMQWQMLPPMTAHAPEVTIAGQLEPAYEVGGDAFDYALNWDVAHVAIFDAMGHGVPASIATALALGSYRNSRRHGHNLLETLRAMDRAVAQEFADERFVTALMAELDLASGRIAFLNAGHLQPPRAARAPPGGGAGVAARPAAGTGRAGGSSG